MISLIADRAYYNTIRSLASSSLPVFKYRRLRHYQRASCLFELAESRFDRSDSYLAISYVAHTRAVSIAVLEGREKRRNEARPEKKYIYPLPSMGRFKMGRRADEKKRHAIRNETLTGVEGEGTRARERSGSIKQIDLTIHGAYTGPAACLSSR